MSDRSAALVESLQDYFGERIDKLQSTRHGVVLEVSPTHLIAVCQALRDEFKFEMLMDLAGVDYMAYGVAEWSTEDSTREGFSRGVQSKTFGRFSFHDAPPLDQPTGPRFAVAYQLLSIHHNQRLLLKIYCADDTLPVVPSVADLWSAANWYEREAFDLFGIVFEGHPDLRRILTDYGFIGHPFRKDFPLIGNVEMRYDEEQGRVVYQPVSIEPRVLVPRVIRDDHRYLEQSATGNKHGDA
ncbi:MAG: NADH-quinone oxidoreductase subunit C [Pseudomonadota bacterium]